MELTNLVILGLGVVLASAIPQGPGSSFGHLNAFVSAASLGAGGDPLVTSASETRFRFGGTGSSNQGSRLFIPGLDRRERKPTGLIGGSSVIGAPPKTTKIPTTTPSSKPKPVIKSKDNKFSDDYYYADDEYYYDYYEYYYDDKATGERKVGPLGALDPPSAPSTRPTTQPTKASTTSRPFRFDFNNKLRDRPSIQSSRTTPLPTRTSSKAQSTRPSLADLLLKRIKDPQESQPSTPVNNDLTGENREPRVIEETHTEKEEMQVHVTTNTESSRVVSSIKASHSITSEDPILTTPTQSFVGETTAATSPIPIITSEVTKISSTTLPETTTKRSIADISETVDFGSFLTGNVNSEERSFKSLDDTQININTDVLATEKSSKAIQTSTTTSTVATLPTYDTESSIDASSIIETLLRKQAEAKTEIFPPITEKNIFGSLIGSAKTVDISASPETTTRSSTTTTAAVTLDPQAFFLSILGNRPYKAPEQKISPTTEASTTTVKNAEKSDENIFDLFPAIQPENISSFDDISSLLPPGYKAPEGEVVEPLVKTVDVSAFLPPGYKPPPDAKPPIVETLDVSEFLPPGYKPQGSDDETSERKVEIEFVDMSSFLPPGFNVSPPEKPEGPPVIEAVDVSAFLPPGYKPPADEKSSPPGPVIETVDVSAFLPPGFKPTEDSVSSSNIATTEATTTTKKGPKGLKFPKRPDRPAFLTTTTPSSGPTASGPPPVKPTIRNIFANRAVTKPFTGWGFTTKPSVPKPVIKSVDPSSFLPPGFESIDPSSFLPPGYEAPEGENVPVRSTPSTKAPTTSTTTTTTTTMRPTTPGTCGSRCHLFATIKITNGTQWYPELANRDTIEWQQLANSIEIELDNIYRSSKALAPWYEGVVIDGFHEGSVLVDYYLQLSNEMNEHNIATNDLKDILNRATASEEGHHILGNFTLDSSSTDFVVMREKEASVLKEDNGYLIPQWLIAVIVIGLASLLFILIFGITVLVNRSRVNKRHNVPLTEEMLNELNKSHMGGGFNHGHHTMGGGGVDNYAMDAGLYDMDAVWNEKRMDRRMMKPPSSQGKGYNPNYNINIYDSWRTDWSGPYGSSATYAKRPRTDTNF